MAKKRKNASDELASLRQRVAELETQRNKADEAEKQRIEEREAERKKAIEDLIGDVHAPSGSQGTTGTGDSASQHPLAYELFREINDGRQQSVDPSTILDQFCRKLGCQANISITEVGHSSGKFLARCSLVQNQFVPPGQVEGYGFQRRSASQAAATAMVQQLLEQNKVTAEMLSPKKKRS